LKLPDNKITDNGVDKLTQNLKDIEELFLPDNYITDKGVYFIAERMKNLRILNIDHNLTITSINSLIQLQNLEYLSAADNEIDDFDVPAMKSSNIREIDMRGNQLSGQIYEDIQVALDTKIKKTEHKTQDLAVTQSADLQIPLLNDHIHSTNIRSIQDERDAFINYNKIEILLRESGKLKREVEKVVETKNERDMLKNTLESPLKKAKDAGLKSFSKT